MIAVGYGVAALYGVALGVAAWGAVRLSRQVSRSRAATIFVFLWGVLASLSVIIVLAGAVSGAGWGVPEEIHLHETEAHLHYAGIAHEASLVVCHHLTYLGLTLPPQTVFVPFLAVGVPLASFLVNQGYMRRVHRRLAARRDVALSERLRGRMASLWPGRHWEILVIDGSGREALSYALLRPRRRPLRFAQDVVVVTKGLAALLREEELVASLAHEYAHLEANDHRYLTFFKTLCAIVFFDPAVLLLSHKLCREAEFRADAEAARVTRNPMALARALLKLYVVGDGAGTGGDAAPGLGKAYVVERIRRLLAMAREMEAA
jgi:Zn-dependent protease with chaperone function